MRRKGFAASAVVSLMLLVTTMACFAEAAVKFTKDLTHDTQAFKASVGASIAVCDVDWKNLFK